MRRKTLSDISPVFLGGATANVVGTAASFSAAGYEAVTNAWVHLSASQSALELAQNPLFTSGLAATIGGAALMLVSSTKELS
jgi:hypothetical protein